MMGERRNWSREETILAYDLYCRIPFGRISSGTPEIIELAHLLGRTPGSVAMKMCNLAHFDPEQINRNVKGLSNGSKMDAEISSEFQNNWAELSFEAEEIKAKLHGHKIEDEVLKETESVGEIEIGFRDMGTKEERDRRLQERIRWNFFSQTVLSSYNNRCCITGLSDRNLLVAEHIKPISSNESVQESTDPQNGISFNALFGKAFNEGLITIDNWYRVLISPHLDHVKMDENTRAWIKSYNHKEIIKPYRFSPGLDYLEYHNDVIYQK